MFETISTTITPSWIGVINATAANKNPPTISDMNNNITTILGNGSIDDVGNETNLFHMCDPSNPEFNCSVEDFLSFYLGAKQMPLETAIWVS